MSAIQGSTRNKFKPTTMVLFKPAGATGTWYNVGNVLEFKNVPNIQRVEHFTAAVGDAGGGVAFGDGNMATQISRKYTAKFDEHTKENLRTILLAAEPTAANQAANATRTVAITDVEPGKSYLIGALGITSHLLTFGGSAKVEGTDFLLDRASGLLTILTGGAILSGDDVAGTVAVPAITYQNYANLSELRVTGTVQVQQYDQNGKPPRRIIDMPLAELYVSDWGNEDHKGYNEPMLELYALAAVNTRERVDV
jgi:hypothetical protein